MANYLNLSTAASCLKAFDYMMEGRKIKFVIQQKKLKGVQHFNLLAKVENGPTLRVAYAKGKNVMKAAVEADFINKTFKDRALAEQVYKTGNFVGALQYLGFLAQPVYDYRKQKCDLLVKRPEY